ncbi:hypothetical protein OIU74_007409 [Salix koriyanagi]|uniref:Uncharacterized protein n=1 Tax=Salix koriyanagi TaxID=2511006 RepID=A0A9Q0U3N8_9ROSI|nr:hypothetical protein OIU74_007409 [Salix koriyanagi]KAJ6722820.1 hypothetical protein OIU74_007409 [Salix koriyanagi]KAJ6722821.1 hypothetical protein OIU74_007409 [Salix koriyanagi]
MIKALVGLLPVCLLPRLGLLFPLHFLAWKGETFSAGRSLFGIERW